MSLCDIKEVAKIEEEEFADPWPARYFSDDLNNNPFSRFFVLKDNEEVIGYVGMWLMFENCDLVNIAIKKAYQGKGLGEKLLKFILSEAIKEKCEFMHLEVRVSNLKAISLYKKYGFEKLRIRQGYYENGEDAIDMMKGLIGLSEKDFSD